MKPTTILSCLAALALCVCAAPAPAAPFPDASAGHAPSARPVDAMAARIACPGLGLIPVQFKPGSVRLHLPFGAIDLSLDEIQNVRYLAAAHAQGSSNAGPDECTVVTVQGDILVGRCPFSDFQRLLKTSATNALPDSGALPSGISFAHQAHGTGTGTPSATPAWQLKLSNGTLLSVHPRTDTFRFETGEGTATLSADLVEFIIRNPATDLLDVRLSDTPYSLQSYLPRGTLQATVGGDHALSIPWNDIRSVSLPSPSVTVDVPVRNYQTAVVGFPDGTNSVSIHFPVSVLVLRSPVGDLPIPSTRIDRIIRNPDRSCTVFTAAGDILTGKLALPGTSLPGPQGRGTRTLDKADSIHFIDHAIPEVPPTALAWRLTSGDVLVATRDSAAPAGTPDKAPPPSSAAPVGRISAVRLSPGSATTARAAPPQPSSDGVWPEKRYTLTPVATALVLDLPSKQLEAVHPLPVSSLPPARIPAGPSAFATDEVAFEGGEFHLGRAAGPGPSDETPAAYIRLAPFALASTPVTVAQFRAFVDDTGYVTSAERMSGLATWKTPGFPQTDDSPVVCVSWLDAANYCNWRSKRARLAPAYAIRDGGLRVTLDPEADGYRLPIEAEWEFAARNGGKDILFPWGDDSTESGALAFANFNPDEAALDPWPNTNPVKAFPAAPSGLYGMAGNVCEWCQDRYDANAYTSYRVGDISDLLDPDPDEFAEGKINRVIRGGSYRNPLSSLRCTARAYGPERFGASHVGFRVARNAD